jgi:hypothetical protein
VETLGTREPESLDRYDDFAFFSLDPNMLQPVLDNPSSIGVFNGFNGLLLQNDGNPGAVAIRAREIIPGPGPRLEPEFSDPPPRVPPTQNPISAPAPTQDPTTASSSTRAIVGTAMLTVSLIPYILLSL